ncbi:MAG: signal transduction histidine kinase [Sulfurimonas sp.]|jgi:signal transduction histidine kinase
MHAPMMYGDDLSTIRKSVVYVNKYNKQIHGFEEGKLSNGFRFIYPMFDKEKYIGSVEISFSALSILTNIMKNYDVFTNMLVRKSVVDRIISKKEQTFYILSPLKDFYFEKRLIKELGAKFNRNENAKEMQKKISPRLMNGELFSVYNKFQDRVITFIPIHHTLTDELQAYIILNSHSDYIDNKITSSIIFIVLNIALFGIILLYIYRGIISKSRLKTSEEKTRTILNSTASMIILSDGKKIIEVNDTFFSFFTQHDTVDSFNKENENFCSVLKPMEGENFIACSIKDTNSWFSDIVDNEKVTFKAVIEKDDELYYFILNVKSAYIEENKMYIIELTDISNEIILAEKVKTKDLQLYEKHKMAQMGEMINNIAHQWRQPLAIINTVIAIMKEKSLQDKLDKSEIAKKLESIESNTTYMSDTIEDFLNFHKPMKCKENFSINETIRATLNIISPSLEVENIDVHTECELEFITLGYEREFSQALLAIVSNAKDALLSKNIKNPWILIKLAKIDNLIELIIEDNAGGIEESVKLKIFEPYFTTKSLEKGSGIGLYIAKMLIENSMSGSIDVVNTKNGAKFIIRFKYES